MFGVMSGAAIAISVFGLLSAYLLGSIPTGFLLAKALKGIDIREHGSGNTGATNVFRVIGKGAGVSALVTDLLKGLLAVWLMVWLVSSPLTGHAAELEMAAAWLYMGAGLLVVIGHSKSVWLGFSGGKSAATGLGVLLALAWPVGLGVAAVFGLVLAISRTVSVGSMAAAVAAIALMTFTHQPLAYIVLTLIGGLYVIFRHRSNISRLLAGTEPKTFGSQRP